MSEFTVITVGSSQEHVLYEMADSVTDFNNPDLWNFIQYLYTDVLLSYRGMAGSQIGLKKRIFGIAFDPQKNSYPGKEIKPKIIINSEILRRSRKKTWRWEACLSHPDFFYLIRRSRWIEVKHQNEHGEVFTGKLDGVEAEIYLHEHDHTLGKVIWRKAWLRQYLLRVSSKKYMKYIFPVLKCFYLIKKTLMVLVWGLLSL